MLSHLFPAVLVTAMLITGALAAGYTGFAVVGHDPIAPLPYWLAFAASFALLVRSDPRAALLAMTAWSVLTALVLILITTVGNEGGGLMAFSAVIGVVAIGSTAAVVRDELRARKQPNPLRSAADRDESILEVGGVQYVTALWPSQDTPVLRGVVVLQNCHDTAAIAHVTVEEEIVNAPGVVLPPPVVVDLAPQGCAAIEVHCPAIAGHRGEGWFHVWVRTDREDRGRRVLLWRAGTGPGSLRATQLSTALLERGRQYLGTKILLPSTPAAQPRGEARWTVTQLSSEELAGSLRGHSAT